MCVKLVVQTICYIDFTGDLRETACGMPVDLISYNGTTVFMSSTTCEKCRAEIQDLVPIRLGSVQDSSGAVGELGPMAGG